MDINLGTDMSKKRKNVSTFGDKLYDNLNFTLHQAGMVGIGPNGAGKIDHFQNDYG
jgi:ABC-type hemin transport system ATPase subunit